MLRHHSFELQALFIITAVVNPVGVKEKNISRVHQCDLGDVGRLCSAPLRLHREITGTVRMIFRNFQTERQKLHHSTLINVSEVAIFSGEHERWGMSEIYEAKVSV